MVSRGWLHDELFTHGWSGSNTSWESGATYNLFVIDNNCVGVDGSDLVYRGKLHCPEEQMMVCCVDAGGQPHACSKDVTCAAARLVEWRIPSKCVPECDVQAFPQVALQNAIYTGVRFFPRVTDETCNSHMTAECGFGDIGNADPMTGATPHQVIQAGSNGGVSLGHDHDVSNRGTMGDEEPGKPLMMMADFVGGRDEPMPCDSMRNIESDQSLGTTLGLHDNPRPHAGRNASEPNHAHSLKVTHEHEHHDHSLTITHVPLPEGREEVYSKEMKGDWGLGVLAPQEVKILLFRVESDVSQVFPKVEANQLADEWSLVELFAGGFAGWKQASKAMTKMGVPWKSTHAVEIREDIAKLYCKTFAVNHIFAETDGKLDDLFPLNAHPVLGDTMYIGDIRNPDWIKLVPWANKIVAAISAPCPPWSRSSDKDGLHHADGRLMIATAVAMKFLRPLAVVLENVDTMRDHRHFKCVRDVLLWAGYRLVWECASDLRKVAPITRKRWLAVFIKDQGEINNVQVSDFLEMPQPNLESHKIMMNLPWEHEKDLTLTGDLMDVYSDVRFATRSMRTRFFREQGQMSSRDVMNMRIKHGRAVLSTFLARYSTQHELPEEKLRTDGLFAELTRGKLGTRFFSPFEIASAHGLVHDLYLPKNVHTAHLVVGNGISTQHAILAMTHARNYVDPLMRCNPQEMVLYAMRDRIHAENSEFSEDEHGWWLKLQTDVIPAAQPDMDEGDETMEERTLDTVLDSSSELLEVPPTLPFAATCQIQCCFPEETHVYITQGDMSLRQVLTHHRMTYALDFAALNDDMQLISVDDVLRSDVTVYFRNLGHMEMALVTQKAAWKVFQPGSSPFQEILAIADNLKLPQLRGYDITGHPVQDHAFNQRCVFTMLTCDAIAFDHVWDFQLIHTGSTKKMLSEIRMILPICRVANDHIAIVSSVAKRSEEQCLMFDQVLCKMHPFLKTLGWIWIPDEGKLLGKFRPQSDLAAPVCAMHLPLVRCLLDGVLAALPGKKDIEFRLKLDGLMMWDKPLSSDLTLETLDAVLQCCLHIVGCSPVTWIHGGKRMLMDDRLLGTLQSYSEKLTLSMIGRSRGGAGAKTEAWKEVKNQLAKLLIQKGWSLASLDEVTSEWIEKIGLSKLQTIFKTQMSHDRKWHSVMDYAKMRDLKVLPDDPVKMRAARTIQQALRKNRAAALVASRFQIADGFFKTHADQPLPVVNTIDLKSTGICLMDFDQAAPWLARDLPVISDELAIITLAGQTIPDDFPEHKELTFPALDDKQRGVVLRGHLWQLGEQKVTWKTHEQSIKQSPTLVIACTIWRDEVSSALWEDFGKSLVKTTFALMVDVDTKSQILQVWGRSFRDDKMRCDPDRAHSAQFHCRIFADQAEEILKTSGRNHIYLTPKSENHLSHPGWSMLWFPDRMSVDIAASKATEHSGVVRVKGKYALRVRATILSQIAKEVKCSVDTTDQLQIQHLYKLQPVPIGIKQEQLVDWALSFGWKIRVVKKLGKDAYLLGTDASPPHPHLSLNGTVVLIKQVTSQRSQQPNSALVAGPRQAPLKDHKEPDTNAMELLSDPWAGFRTQQGLPLGSTGASAAKPTVKADDKKLDEKFDKLMLMLQSSSHKRKDQAPSEDHFMESPTKEL
eukprot:Skav204963  [mRNA]  locus=scaffold3912:113355:118505:- [translate_table: standard]